jgi:hypothetical protein
MRAAAHRGRGEDGRDGATVTASRGIGRGGVSPVKVGDVFGRLTVVAQAQTYIFGATGRQRRWLCACECGGETVTRTVSLTSGATRSCGCLQREKASVVFQQNRKVGGYKHGGADMRRGSTYLSWCAMKQRCSTLAHSSFSRYGGRGITVCARWKDSFENFLADMGERPPGKTLDRIDGDGNYEPGNCRWATPKEQTANRRPTKRPNTLKSDAAIFAAENSGRTPQENLMKTPSRPLGPALALALTLALLVAPVIVAQTATQTPAYGRPTNTPTTGPSATIPPTRTSTATSTATRTPTRTNTPVPPTATITGTRTATPANTATQTPKFRPTNTPTVGPSATPKP